MVDLGISRTQDVQNPLQATAPGARLPKEAELHAAKAVAQRSVRRRQTEPARAETPRAVAPATDLEKEVQRYNELMGSNTRIRFAINRSNNDVYVEVVDKESNKVVKTIPPSEFGEVASKLTGGGILVDNKL